VADMNKVHLGTIDGYGISEDGPYLICECGRSRALGPCDHVWQAMKRHMDARERTGMVSIPMYKLPVQGVGLYVSVHVNQEHSVHGMRPFRIMGHEPAHQDDHHIGWLAQTEGRWEMRRVVFEFLRGFYRTVAPCLEPTHSKYLLSHKERAKQDLDSKTDTVLAAIASMIQYGKCWSCYNSKADDLIPDI